MLLVIILTLFIEILVTLVLGKINSSVSLKIKIAILITVANIASFIFPYIFRAIEFLGVSGGWSNAWYDAFNAGPFYIVLTGYLFLTLVIEIPIIYLYVKKHTKNKVVLLAAIISANVFTTLIVAVIERMMFYGHW